MVQPPEFAHDTPQLWQEIANEPSFMHRDGQIDHLLQLNAEHYRSSCQMGDYYWNTGVPYTTVEREDGSPAPSDSMRLSFAWDRPDGDDFESTSAAATIIRKVGNTRYINDKKIDFTSLEPMDQSAGIAIGEGVDGRKYLVQGKNRIISPGFQWIDPEDAGHFTVPDYGNKTATLRILGDAERQEILAKRQEHEGRKRDVAASFDALPELQASLAEDILARYGVQPRINELVKYANATTLNFEHLGSDVEIQISGSMISVEGYRNSLSREERQAADQEYEALRQRAAQISILDTALDTKLPEWLQPYETQIMDTMDDHTAEKREFNQYIRNFCNRFGKIEFTVESTRLTQALPIIMQLLNLPEESRYDLLGPFASQSGGFLSVKVPGTMTASRRGNLPELTWKLDAKGWPTQSD